MEIGEIGILHPIPYPLLRVPPHIPYNIREWMTKSL